MRTAEVVVIGGGCMGTSVLHHLAKLGCSDVVLLEAQSLGSGSTSKAAGGIRMQHDDELNTRIALRSLREFEHFEEITGTPIGFQQVGYLFLINSEQVLETFRRTARVQRELGAPTEILTVADVNDKVPGVRTDDLVGASFCAIEGYATPEAVVQGYATAARRAGTTIRTGEAAAEIIVDSSGIAGVRTTTETYHTRNVVITAGVGSRAIAKGIGIDLPVHAEPRTIYYSSDAVGVPAHAPLVVDHASNFYFHREREGLIFAGPQHDLMELSESAVQRLPALENAAIEGSWSGDYDMSPDGNAMVGKAAVQGLTYATGFSGHGFMQSPAIGEHLAELVLGHKPTLDLSELSTERFARGQTRTEALII